MLQRIDATIDKHREILPARRNTTSPQRSLDSAVKSFVGAAACSLPVCTPTPKVIPMRRFLMHGLLLLSLFSALQPSFAQLQPEALKLRLTMEEFIAWTADGDTALPANISQVPLAARQTILRSQLDPNQSFATRINYVPDGMLTWAGYLTEQPKFNLYNFTHWQYVDVLTWFDGPAAIPARPWIEAAHRNGVKIIGTVFPTTVAEVQQLVEKDGAGRYIGAQKLIDIASYYGFDGWFFNVEVSVSSSVADELQRMLRQAQASKPAGMEIHWYDSMLPSGIVWYQNALNNRNKDLLQNGPTRVNDAMFTNYFWSGSRNIDTSVNTAAKIGRSPFDAYMGADMWPGRSSQPMFENNTWIDSCFSGADPAAPLISLGLFAANLTYNSGLTGFDTDPTKSSEFYSTEARMFAGDDLNSATTDNTGWKGFGHYLPVRTVYASLPFETTFNTGQGRVFASRGVQEVRDWTDMSQQSSMPSWQWASYGGRGMVPSFDFDVAYDGGSSLKFSGHRGSVATSFKLFQTRITITPQTKVDVSFLPQSAGATDLQLLGYFSDDLQNPVVLNLGQAHGTKWQTKTFSLARHAGRELAVIGARILPAAAGQSYRINVGKLKLYE
jgi:endo-beta-N-acetylglucosaminidase D